MTRWAGCVVAMLTATMVYGAGGGVRPDPDPPMRDLTKTIGFVRHGDYALGPTGMRGWMHVRYLMTNQARQILVTQVDAGSPADGVFQEGDVILGVNGQPFDGDPRRILGMAIDRAESEVASGKLTLTRWRATSASPRRGTSEEVVLQLRVMGAYSKTAPYDCAKSDKIYDGALAALAADKSMGRLKALAFLASGEPEHIERVGAYLRKQGWASPKHRIEVDRGGKMTWSSGFGLLIMCEYYLLTKDDYVLPAIKETAVKASMGQSRSGTWGHGFALPRNNNGKIHGDLVGYGALNLPSLHVVNGLLLAKRCGVEHAEIDQAIERALTFFRQFAGHGSISYGQHRPSFEHRAAGRNALGSNGKNALAALAFAQAGDEESARFFSKLVASSYDNYEYGHAGNSFTAFWRMMGANVGGPANAAAFHKSLRWYNTLTRRHDGGFAFQPLGGYYGGETLNVTAAQVLAHGLSKKSLLITGRGGAARVSLSADEVTAANRAGQWRNADYASLSTTELIEALDSFSPSAREWIAKALGKRSDVDVAVLIGMLNEGSVHQRAGAATALGYQGKRAAEAIPDLLDALEDPAAPVRVAASYGIALIGSETDRIVNGMLQAVLQVHETEPIQPTTQALAYALGYRQSYIAPLYFDGVLASVPDGADPLAGVDRELLYAAVRKLAKNNNGRVRSAGVAPIQDFNREDMARNAQLIVDLIDESPRGHVMFRDSARAVAITALAKHRIVDGMDYALDRLDFGHWGAVMRFPHRFKTMQEYGGLASFHLPQLKQLRRKVSGGENRMHLEKAIEVIEAAGIDQSGETLMGLVGPQLQSDLGLGKSKHQRISRCRALFAEYADDGFWVAAILEDLAAMDAVKTSELLHALGHRNPLARETAIRLAPVHLGWFGRRSVLKRLEIGRPREQASIIAMLPELKKQELALPFVGSEHDEVRAAVLALQAERMTLDAGLLVALDDPGEQTSRLALHELIRRASPAVTKAVETAFEKADEAKQIRFFPYFSRLGGDVDSLLGFVEKGPESVRRAALDALATYRDFGAYEALMAKATDEDRKNRYRNRYLQALIYRVVGGMESDKRHRAVFALALQSRDVSVSRLVIGEAQWMPPSEAVGYLLPYLSRIEKKDGDVAKRAVAAIRSLAERHDPKQHPTLAAALKMLEK